MADKKFRRIEVPLNAEWGDGFPLTDEEMERRA